MSRLFDPGPKSSADPWKLHPDNWVAQPGIVYHGTDEPALPRHDRGSGHSVDYGGSEGMHFGSKYAAYDRASVAGGNRKYIHSARLNAAQFPAPSGEPHSDDEANYGTPADKAVSEGKVVPYRNEYEGHGDVSYRAKPESVRTWSDDVHADPNAHPALKYLAERGYNPTLMRHEVVDHKDAYYEAVHGSPAAPQLFGGDVVKNGKAVSHHVELNDAISVAMQPGKGSGVGFRNNNLTKGQFYERDAVESAKPRLRRTSTTHYS